MGFVGSTFAGYDPELIGRMTFDEVADHHDGFGSVMLVNDDYTYLALQSGIKIINTKNKDQPVLEAGIDDQDLSDLQINAYSLFTGKNSNYFYALNDKRQLVTFSWDKPNRPQRQGEISCMTCNDCMWPQGAITQANDVWLLTPKGILANNWVGFYTNAAIYDASTNITSLGAFTYDDGTNYLYWIDRDDDKSKAKLKIYKTPPHAMYARPADNPMIYTSYVDAATTKCVMHKTLAHTITNNAYTISIQDYRRKIFNNSQTYKYAANDVNIISNIAVNDSYSVVALKKQADNKAMLKIYYHQVKPDGYYDQNKSGLIKTIPLDFLGSEHCTMVIAGDYLHLVSFESNHGEYQIIRLGSDKLHRIAIITDAFQTVGNKCSFMQLSVSGRRYYLDDEQDGDEIETKTTWDTSDHSTAVINDRGVLFAYRPGIVEVTATYTDKQVVATDKTTVAFEDSEAKKTVVYNLQFRKFLPTFLTQVTNENITDDIASVIYNTIKYSSKFDPEREAIKKMILGEIIKKKYQLKQPELVQDIEILHEKLEL